MGYLTFRRHSFYRITNKNNGKNYIGQSGNVVARFWQHQNDAKRGNPKMLITKVIKRYGEEQFDFVVIAEGTMICTCKPGIPGPCQIEANEIERYLIVDQYKSLVKDGNGYNIKEGGNASPVAEETKQKIAKSLLGWHASPSTEFKQGHEVKEEWIEAGRKANLGRPSWNKGTRGMTKSWNKGTKGLTKANSGSFKPGHEAPETAFKEGNVPKNKKYEVDLDRVKELRKSGMSAKEIAMELGLSLQVVYRDWNKGEAKDRFLTEMYSRAAIKRAKDYPITEETRRKRSISLRGKTSKITKEQAMAIFNDTRYSKVIAAEYGIDRSTVCDIRRGKIWAWATGANYEDRDRKIRLTEDQILAIFNDPRKQIEIAKEYNIDRNTVGKIKSGREHAEITGVQYEKSETLPSAKLSEDKVLAIFSDNRKLRLVAEEYGVNISVVDGIRSGRSYSSLTGKKYVKDPNKVRLTDDQIVAIFNDPRKQTDIARDYGISQGTVSDIKLRKRHPHLTSSTPSTNNPVSNITDNATSTQDNPADTNNTVEKDPPCHM